MRTLAQDVTALTEIGRLPLLASTFNPVRAQLRDLAVALNATFVTGVSYSENASGNFFSALKPGRPDF